MKNLIIVAFLFGSFAFGQNFNITEELSFGGSAADILKVIPDGNNTGYIFYGSSTSSNSIDHQSSNFGGQDVWVVRTDMNYNILWENSYGGSGSDAAQDAFVLDSHIYVVTLSNSPISGNKTTGNFGMLDVWLLKLDMDGSIVWQETYGGTETERSVGISFYENQIVMYAVSGSGNSGNITTNNQGFTDCWVALLDTNNGAINTQAMYGSSSLEDYGGLFVLGDRLFIMTNSFGADGDIPEMDSGFNEDIIVFELDQSLNILSTHGFYGSSVDFGRGLIKNELTNEYFLITESQSNASGDKTSDSFGSFDIWLLRLDENFNILWDTIYGGSNYEVSTEFSHFDDNGSLVLVSTSASITNSGNKEATLHGFEDLWLTVIHPQTGEKIVEHSFGGDQNESPTGMLPLGNGKLLLVGYTESNISGNKTVPVKGLGDTWIIETDASNFLNISEADNTGTATFYPNPTNDMVTLSLNNEVSINRAQFFTIDGQLLMEKEISSNSTTIQFDFTDVPAGVIVYKLSGDLKSYHGRIVKR